MGYLRPINVPNFEKKKALTFFIFVSLLGGVNKGTILYFILHSVRKFYVPSGRNIYRKVVSTNASRLVTHLVYKRTQNDNFLNRSPSSL
jgi:hypothetical protein